MSDLITMNAQKKKNVKKGKLEKFDKMSGMKSKRKLEKFDKMSSMKSKGKLEKFDQMSSMKSKHSTESGKLSKNINKKRKQTGKELVKKGNRKEMEVGDISHGVDRMGNGTKKRKMNDNSHDGSPLKKLKHDGQMVSVCRPTEQSKEAQDSKLTRKQRRNRKKNNSKKNKYKHLALNQPNNCLVKDSQNLDVKQSSVGVSVSELSCSQKFQKERLSHSDPLATSAEQKVHAARRLTLSQEPVNSPKTKKKAVKKHQKQKILKKTLSKTFDTLHSFESDDDDYDDNDDWTQDASDNESISRTHSDEVSGTCSIKTTERNNTISESRPSTKPTKSFSVLDKAHEKLNAARFRFLNEQLYTSTGAEAMNMFQDDPEAFEIYHQGFQQQVTQWPVNPLDSIIKQLSKMSKSTTVADFGCGDARLAESLPHNVVHSFDLVSTKPCVTACDIAKVPLDNSSVNVAVFCLSLMGTNLTDYLCEANRVLQKGGILKIAEVVSRFHSVSRFVQNVQALGFHLQKKTCLSKMFMLLTFKKVADSSRKCAPRIQLKACLYKRR